MRTPIKTFVLRHSFIAVLALSAAGAGCAHTTMIPGTTVADTELNREIIGVVEQYRAYMLTRDVDRLMMLASPNYFEDGGTPTAADDYGYDGLKQVLKSGLSRVESLRFELQYRKISLSDNNKRADVEVFVRGSYEVKADGGERYRPKNDYGHFELERIQDHWKFRSGM